MSEYDFGFADWLEKFGDELAEPMTFDEWLRQNGDEEMANQSKEGDAVYEH